MMQTVMIIETTNKTTKHHVVIGVLLTTTGQVSKVYFVAVFVDEARPAAKE